MHNWEGILGKLIAEREERNKGLLVGNVSFEKRERGREREREGGGERSSSKFNEGERECLEKRESKRWVGGWVGGWKKKKRERESGVELNSISNFVDPKFER